MSVLDDGAGAPVASVAPSAGRVRIAAVNDLLQLTAARMRQWRRRVELDARIQDSLCVQRGVKRVRRASECGALIRFVRHVDAQREHVALVMDELETMHAALLFDRSREREWRGVESGHA